MARRKEQRKVKKMNKKEKPKPKPVIQIVWMNKTNKQLLVTVPRGKGIEAGDYVKLMKVD